MKKFNFFKFVSVTMAVLACTLNVSCVDDNDDTEAPYLEVSPSTLSFDANGVPVAGSQAFFQISTNRHWTATVQSEKSWITLSATEGDGSADIQVSIPEGINDQATVTIAISNKMGTLMSQTVTIVSGSVLPTATIYRETFGTAAPSSSPYPFVDAYTGWDKSGEGSSTTEYTGVAASVRQSGKLSAGYEGASGGAKLFFGSGANFVINKITLQEAQTNLKLTFGGSYSKNTNGVYDNVFKPELFHVYLSADGTTWSNALTYETKQADDYWVFATSHFTLKNPTTTLYIKYVADEASVFSMDDPTLVTGPGGQEVVFDNTPEPGEAKVITIPDMIQAMTTAQTVLDATADRFFEAIVQNDTVGGNYSFNNLILTTVGATTAGNGITLYGSQVEPTAIKVNKGDKVKVTLYKGLAKLVNYKGMYEVTGAKEDTWAKVEKIGTATVTPIVITADKLADYQGMPVTIQNATIATAGIWATNADISSHNFTVQTTSFVVFCKKGAGVFVDAPFNAATGAISGLAAVNNNIGQLVPRDLNDVKAFNSTSPLITAVDPTSLSFDAAGGTKTIQVTISNQGSNTLSVSGLSGTLSASVNNSVVTVTAAENTGAAVSQTLSIALQNGNTVTVPVAQAAKSTGNTTTLSMTSQNIIDGKTGTVELVANAYGSQTVADLSSWYTWASNNINFTGSRICIAPASNGGGIQVQGNASDVAKQGRIANVTALPAIQSMVVVLRVVTTSQYEPAYNVYAGTSVNPSKSDATINRVSTVETVGDYKVYTQTFDFTNGNYSYFSIINDLAGALYIDSIAITYKK